MRAANSIKRAASSAKMSLSSCKSPALRQLIKTESSSSGMLELLSVLEFKDGKRVFRLIYVTSVPDFELELFDASGNLMQVAPILLTDGVLEGVISVKLPSDIDGFFAHIEGAPVLRVTHHDIMNAIAERDRLMINPGIDDSYVPWASVNQRYISETVEMCESLKDEFYPLMSIITPVFNTPIRYLTEMVDSVRAQIYPNWEHILVNASPENEEVCAFLDSLDDERFKVITLDENKGIAENTLVGIEASKGDYISFLDHDDTIEPVALTMYVLYIHNSGDVDVIYCDEDTLSEDGKSYSAPIFKPSFNVDLFTSWNYVLHMLTISRAMFNKIEDYGKDVNGSQDYDLVLKALDAGAHIINIPAVLYHWRAHDGSVNSGKNGVKPYAAESSIKALQRHQEFIGMHGAKVSPHEFSWLYRTDYPISNECDVSVVISASSTENLRQLLESMKTQRMSIVREIIVAGIPECDLSDIDEKIANLVKFMPCGVCETKLQACTEEESFEEYESDKYKGVFETELESSSRAKCLNEAVKFASGSYILLVDGGVTFLPDYDAIGRLRDTLQRKDVGVASAKAMAKDELNLHVGLCLNEDLNDGSIVYPNQGFIHGMGGGYNGYAECQCDYSAVDAICMAFRKSDFELVGGFTETYATRVVSAASFSFRMRNNKLLVMVDPFALVESKASIAQLMLGERHPVWHEDELHALWLECDDVNMSDVLGNINVDQNKAYFNLDKFAYQNI